MLLHSCRSYTRLLVMRTSNPHASCMRKRSVRDPVFCLAGSSGSKWTKMPAVLYLIYIFFKFETVDFWNSFSTLRQQNNRWKLSLSWSDLRFSQKPFILGCGQSTATRCIDQWSKPRLVHFHTRFSSEAIRGGGCRRKIRNASHFQ